MYITTQAEQ